MKTIPSKYDICIIGAGVAGATLAAYLAPSGIKIAIIEKEWEASDRIVGELLQPGGFEMLKQMQLAHLLENIDAQEVNGYAIFLNEKHFTIKYTSNDKTFAGKGFHNHLFLKKVRAYLQTFENIDIIIGNAENYILENNKISGIDFSNENGAKETIHAHLNVFTDGIFSYFRNHLTNAPKQITSYFLGMVLKNCEPPFPNYGHVIVSNNIPCLVYPISSNEYRMLIDFKGENPPRKSENLKQYLLTEIGKNIPTSLIPSYINAVNEGKFKVMPNHRLPANPKKIEGSVILGDALNMRHPLTGGGMTVAFTDVKLIGDLLLNINEFENNVAINQAVNSFYQNRTKETATINILADALYGVFSNESLRDGCFEYLSQGGKQASEPIAILAAINRNKKNLEKHFFAVAAFGAKKHIKDSPLKGIKIAYKSMSDAIKIVAPLLESEKPTRAKKIMLKIAQKIT